MLGYSLSGDCVWDHGGSPMATSLSTCHPHCLVHSTIPLYTWVILADPPVQVTPSYVCSSIATCDKQRYAFQRNTVSIDGRDNTFPFLKITRMRHILSPALMSFILAPKHAFNPQFNLFNWRGVLDTKIWVPWMCPDSHVGRNAVFIVIAGTLFPTQHSITLTSQIYSHWFPKFSVLSYYPISLITWDSINHQDFLSRTELL